MNNIKFKLVSIAAALLASIYTQSALAIPVYEALPSSNSINTSVHTSGGPVLADDFTPAASGIVSRVDWWGSAPLSSTGSDSWEITFHPDAGGAPDTAFATAILSQHFVTATGSDLDGDGIFFYSAMWSPMDLSLTAGTDYWFSVANASGATWTWANALAPTVGSEQYAAMVSSGALGSPHFGPWSTALDATGAPTDFAFRIHVTPEPGILALLGIGLAAIGFARKRRIS